METEKEEKRIWAKGEKWTRRFLNLKNVAWLSVHDVTGKDIFQIQNGNVAQSAEALGSLERKRRKTRILPPVVINCKGYLSDSLLKEVIDTFCRGGVDFPLK